MLQTVGSPCRFGCHGNQTTHLSVWPINSVSERWRTTHPPRSHDMPRGRGTTHVTSLQPWPLLKSLVFQCRITFREIISTCL